jgi:FMN-dependent NADH-azoreductase
VQRDAAALDQLAQAGERQEIAKGVDDGRRARVTLPRADRIIMGVPMWNFSFPYKLKQLIDLTCQRNMLFTFDGKRYGPSLDIEKAFVAFVRGQSDEAGFETVPQPGFQYLSGYVEFWLRFIGVREVMTLTLEHTWDGRAVDMIDAGKKKAAELAKQF